MRKNLKEKAARPTLGGLIASLRQQNGWTLKELSERVGIPLSTLAKVEDDKLSLNYEKLQQLTGRLNLTLADFLAGASPSEGNGSADNVITGRRSLTSEANTVKINTPSYDYEYLCADLRDKRMVPILSRVHAKSLEEFDDLMHHKGEEFVFVLEGKVEVHLEFYTPVIVPAGKGIYIDSSMGHAYLAKDCETALILTVCSSENRALENELIGLMSN